MAGQGEAGRKVNGGRRLTDTALLIDDGERLRYVVTWPSWIWPVTSIARMILRTPAAMFHDSHCGAGETEVFHDSHTPSPQAPFRAAGRPRIACSRVG